jgi:HlyD family secretion protein
MKERKTEILYSDQVDEIISKPPARIIRWGTLIIFSVFVLLVTLASIIKYPDVIPAPIEITTTNPPVILVSKITGRINKLYVENGQNVSEGTLMAVMETAASIEEFRYLKTVTDTISDITLLSPANFPQCSQLGEIQPFYSSFLRALAEYEIYVKNDIYGSRITSALEEISALNEYITRLRAKERLLSENLELESRQYSRDSILHINKVLSESSFETSRQTWNRSRLSLQEVRIEQSARSIDLAQKNKALQDYRIMREEEREKLASSLRESWQKLRAEIHIWENTYLLVSPVTGRVTFTKYWSENQSVMTDEQVLTVIPEMSGDYLGRIRLSMTRSGKVTPGRDVYIKLSGYPYLEYGMLRGRVISKSMVPSGDSYVIEVSFPSGLITLYGRKLEFNQNMQGIAEIVTDDLRLIQKIINPFRHLITRNRD